MALTWTGPSDCVTALTAQLADPEGFVVAVQDCTVSASSQSERRALPAHRRVRARIVCRQRRRHRDWLTDGSRGGSGIGDGCLLRRHHERRHARGGRQVQRTVAGEGDAEGVGPCRLGWCQRTRGRSCRIRGARARFCVVEAKGERLIGERLPGRIVQSGRDGRRVVEVRMTGGDPVHSRVFDDVVTVTVAAVVAAR